MQHLDYKKRMRIQSLMYDSLHHYSQSKIAKIIGVSKWTISNELKWFKENWVLYDAEIAQKNKQEKRRIVNKSVHSRIILWTKLAEYIAIKIQEYRSPEQITKTWNEMEEDNLAVTTLYLYIYTHHSERKKKYLRRKGKRYKHSNEKQIKILNRVSIEERPNEVEDMSNEWHLEWDTIVWINKADCIITIVDRKTSYLRAMVVQLQKWESLSVVVSTLIWNILSWVRKELVKTLTLDNGTEFADHEYITTRTWTKVYFAHPYHSRERWLNENTNWLLRQFLPKKTSFKTLDQNTLDSYVNLINNRPRKKLNRKSPMDVFGK